MVWKGSARKLLFNKAVALRLIEKYIPKEKIVNIHYSAKKELNGVFILDIWIELVNGYTSFIAVDSPVPLNFKQWEIIANTLNKMYMKNRICILSVNSETEKQTIIDKLMTLSGVYGEKTESLLTINNLEKIRTICDKLCRPWNVILALKINSFYETYLAPRIVVDEAICSSRGYWTK